MQARGDNISLSLFFNGRFDIITKRIVGEKHLKMVLQPHQPEGGSSTTIDAIAFNVTDEEWPTESTAVDAVYRLDINEYMGKRSAQLLVENIEPIII